MRKDVKIGLGIGGVLLAVLIVYVLVPKNKDDQIAREGDVTAVDGGQAARAGGAGAGTDATAGGANSSAGAGGASQETSANSGQPTPAGGERDAAARQQANAGGAESTTGQTGAGAAGENDVAAGSGPKFDWNKILTEGVVPEEARVPLVAPTNPADDDVFGDAKKPTNGGANDNIVWPRGTSGGSTGGSTTGNTGGNSTGRQPTPPAAPGGAQPPQPAGQRNALTSHVVQAGETYSSIALAVYGDARYYSELKNANPTIDERRLKPGTTIKIPDRAAFKPRATQQQGGAVTAGATPAAAVPQIDAAREYRVGPGESLYKISLKLYGKADKADALYELNKDKIGDDPARVKVGMVLKLPQPPASVSSTR